MANENDLLTIEVLNFENKIRLRHVYIIHIQKCILA